MLLTSLRLAETLVSSEEEAEERINLRTVFSLHGDLHVDDSVHGRFCGIGEIRIIILCQIDSSVRRTVRGDLLDSR